jgi:hypothetical protein
MDTRYWGPSGWKLLHLITFSNESKGNKPALIEFFKVLPYVLPCKYCRASLSEYMTELPIEKATSLERWLWKIHNKVNAKLRSQGLPCHEDAAFEKVSAIYTEKYQQGCSKTIFDGWEFLFSIAENHPLNRTSRVVARPEDQGMDDLKKNYLNLLASEDRLVYYERFWELLPTVLPYTSWQNTWASVTGTEWGTRKDALQSLWQIRKILEAEMDLRNRTSYNSLCKVLQNHRSGCHSSRRAKTCRRRKNTNTQ